jgi:hypothetical protein
VLKMTSCFRACILRHAVLLLLFFSRIDVITSSTGTGVSGFGSRSLKKTIFPIIVSANNNNLNIAGILSKKKSDDDDTVSIETTPGDSKIQTDHPRLWVQKSNDPEALWIQVRDDDDTTPRTMRLTVAKETGDWNMEEKEESGLDSEWVPIEGLYGFYKLPSGILWVLVSKTEPTYTAPPLNDDDSWWQIRRVSNFELVHLSRPETLLAPSHLKEEARQLRLLRKSLKEHELYFVPEESNVITDMTAHLQKSLDRYNSDSEDVKSWWESKDRRPDPRFFWNQVAAEPLLQRFEKPDSRQRYLAATLLQHVIPLTSAFVGVQKNLTAGEEASMTYDQVLISRRSRFRAGTRFTRRGADASGAVANFAETEQICLTTDGKTNTLQSVMSHIQIRGSIPIRWSSPADVKTYRPLVRIGTDPLAQARALRLHLLEQFAYYVSFDGLRSSSNSAAKIVFLNLIDKKKDQGRLGRAFDSVLNAVMEVYAGNTTEPATLLGRTRSSESNTSSTQYLAPKTVEHVWFDFHAEVKDGRWDRLSGLLNDLKPALVDHGYFLADVPTNKKGWGIQRRQNAVVRTNCMDCLDRTNVVQSIFGRYVLFQQMSAAAGNLISSEKKAKKTWVDYTLKFRKKQMSLPWSKGEVAHRLLWADNADAISRMYAGTPALKGDFTRTGKRTKRGALDDGMNSLQRYYLNNFLDADRQEGMDLLVGYANFSNAAFLEEDVDTSSEDEESSSSSHGDEKALLSIQEAARQTFLGSVLDGLNGQERTELQQRLGDIGLDEGSSRKSLDLRWLPGDLQSHLISQADDARASTSSSTILEEDDMNGGFCSSKALEAIDRRAASDLPWWAEYEDAMNSDTEEAKGLLEKEETEEGADEQESSQSKVALPSTGRQQHPRMGPVQMVGVLFVGIKAPMSLAVVVVSLLGLAFLPALLQNDFKI